MLLATLSIPLPSAHPEFDRFIETDKSPLEKAQRLAILLGLLQPPTRASLLKDIVSSASHNISPLTLSAFVPVQQVYAVLCYNCTLRLTFVMFVSSHLNSLCFTEAQHGDDCFSVLFIFQY